MSFCTYIGIEPVKGHVPDSYLFSPHISSHFSSQQPFAYPPYIGIEPVKGHVPDSYLECLQHIQKNGNTKVATFTLKTSMALQQAGEMETAGTIPEPQGTLPFLHSHPPLLLLLLLLLSVVIICMIDGILLEPQGNRPTLPFLSC